MEQDQKLVIHCDSEGDFHSPRAAGELFWGLVTSSGNRNYVLATWS